MVTCQVLEYNANGKQLKQGIGVKIFIKMCNPKSSSNPHI